MESTWSPDIRPVMITDDIAFVGGKPVSVHAIFARDGIILLDSGYPVMTEGIEQNLNALGRSFKEVIAIIHTHGHIDHYGGTARIRRISGCKTYIGREDAPIVTGQKDLSWAKEIGIPHAETFTPDVCFQDGDVLRISDRVIRCIHAPGHTEGTYAFLIDTKANGVSKIAAMHGGIGMNSMKKAFLESYGLPLELRERFREGLHRLSACHVDIVLGNHPQQNDTEGKIARLSGTDNPFEDAAEWPRFLQGCEERLDRLLREEETQA